MSDKEAEQQTERVLEWYHLMQKMQKKEKVKKELTSSPPSGIIGRTMKAVVTIQMDNQAFEQPHTCMELEKILCKRIADTVGRQAIDSVGHECSEADSNGNYIAKLKIVED